MRTEICDNASGKCTSLAVFDSKLDNFLLPLMRPPSPGGFMQEEAQASASNTRRESVGFLAERYFEWTGTVEEGTPGLLNVAIIY